MFHNTIVVIWRDNNRGRYYLILSSGLKEVSPGSIYYMECIPVEPSTPNKVFEYLFQKELPERLPTYSYIGAKSLISLC